MEIKMTRFYFNCDDGDIFDDDAADLIPIDAETQAEAEAKLLAEPGLIGVSNIDDFDVSFRAEVSDRYFHPQGDNTIKWLTVIQVILTHKKGA
jgi:hypothetical protein